MTLAQHCPAPVAGTVGPSLTLMTGRFAPAHSPSLRSRPAERRPVTGWESLTEAEWRVVNLAADGLTNREIGERLFISHRAVGTHLAHALDKLELRSRVELAREAGRRCASLSRACS